MFTVFLAEQQEEDLADEEKGTSERADIPDIQVDTTGSELQYLETIAHVFKFRLRISLKMLLRTSLITITSPSLAAKDRLRQ